MKKNRFILLSFLLLALFNGLVNGQDDETRQASGLPVLVGENASNRTRGTLSGKLTVEGLEAGRKKPIFFVIVYYTGALIDKRQVDDNGFYYVPSVPREGAVLALEVDGVEVARYPLPPTASGSIRQDLMLNLAQGRSAKEKAGVISAWTFYQRTSENEKIYDKATAASRENKPDIALKLFKQVVKNDPKDFVAWTELGTVYFKNQNLSEAEEAYKKALEQKPDFIVALVNSGKLFLAQKQADKAIPILVKAVEAESQSADAQHYLGEAYLQIQKGSKAVVHLNEALRIAPVEKAEIHLRLASLYNAAGLKNKAVAEYKIFLEKVPQYAEKAKIEKYINDNSSK